MQFGSLGANTEVAMILGLKGELDVVADFSAFIVFAPRTLDGDRTTNCVNYAEQVVSSTRGHYSGMHGRRPGLSNGKLGGKQLHYTLNVFRKLAPSK